MAGPKFGTDGSKPDPVPVSKVDLHLNSNDSYLLSTRSTFVSHSLCGSFRALEAAPKVRIAPDQALGKRRRMRSETDLSQGERQAATSQQACRSRRKGRDKEKSSSSQPPHHKPLGSYEVLHE